MYVTEAPTSIEVLVALFRISTRTEEGERQRVKEVVEAETVLVSVLEVYPVALVLKLKSP